MNIIQEKKMMQYFRIRAFFNDFGDTMAATYPAIGAARTEFDIRFDAMEQPSEDVVGHKKTITNVKNQLKEECLDSIWSLMSAMKFRFKQTNDEVGAETVKIGYTKFSKLGEDAFYAFCQKVMNLYDPAIYTPLGVEEAEMNALKLKLVDFPNQMQAAMDGRVVRKKAVTDLKDMQKAMDEFIKFSISTLIVVAAKKFSVEKKQYFNILHIGLKGITTGKPDKKGEPKAAEIMVLDKKAYHDKVVIAVTNKGATPLAVGRSTNQTELQGTPFIIEPGKTRRRINQKLGSKGQYLLVQNLGEEKGKFEVWIKE